MPNFRNENPMCHQKEEDLSEHDYTDKKETHGQVRYFTDGTSRVDWGGPCGSTCYDDNGEEC